MSMYNDLSRDRMRQIMGSFCSGITIITTQTPEGPAGFTCQSFTSLSMDPPLIAFNPMKASTSWPRIREMGTFCVNILSTDSRQVSGQFARSGADKFEGVTHSHSPLGNPILDCALAWVDCELEAEYDGGDHTIVVGEVVWLEVGSADEPALVWFRSDFTTLQQPALHSPRR
jgi:3-hydroxy-9,10-secoandrosta-1,3,5(10)-triene-9,17-dione monooxygenase reductase component